MELHHRLNNRTEIKGELVLETALHVGTSQQESRTDSPVVRTQFGEAFIPGASLKGAFRSRVESLAHMLKDPVWVCYLQKGLSTDESKKCLSTDQEGAKEIQNKAAEEEITSKKLSVFLDENLCSACQLFGGASWQAKVLFDDVHLMPSYNFSTELRDGVGIDRDSRKAVDRVKYDFEAVPAGSRFEVRLHAENLVDRDWAMLSIGLLELLHGNISLGGKTSRGLGSCRLDSESLEIRYTDFKDKTAILSYFAAEPPVPVDNPENWLLNKLENFLKG